MVIVSACMNGNRCRTVLVAAIDAVYTDFETLGCVYINYECIYVHVCYCETSACMCQSVTLLVCVPVPTEVKTSLNSMVR